MRYLNSDDARRVLSMPVAIDLMRTAFYDLGKGMAQVPVRTSFTMGSTGRNRALAMPAEVASFAAGLKFITVVPSNREKGLPTSSAVILIADAESGNVRAIIEAEALTAIRTGAGSGLATDLLADPDASVVAIFGAGAQAETQLEAVCCVRPVTTALVFNRTRANADAFARRMSSRLNIEVRVSEDQQELQSADIICTATASVSPVLEARHLKSKVHINGVGSYRPDMAEIPADVVTNSYVIADHLPACFAEAGDILQPIASGAISDSHIAGDLGGILTGRVRAIDKPWTFFKSVGVACQDIAVGHFVAKKAEELDLGIVLPASH
ncbi:MAG: hypothetical protein HKN43_15210 [Rhodothermales bacterium]|nr:hypothetical protein [Rhodothermales bacterium]